MRSGFASFSDSDYLPFIRLMASRAALYVCLSWLYCLAFFSCRFFSSCLSISERLNSSSNYFSALASLVSLLTSFLTGCSSSSDFLKRLSLLL